MLEQMNNFIAALVAAASNALAGNLDAAKSAIELVRASDPDFRIQSVKYRLPHRQLDVLTRWEDALRKVDAGIIATFEEREGQVSIMLCPHPDDRFVRKRKQCSPIRDFGLMWQKPHSKRPVIPIAYAHCRFVISSPP
jgi:hypothetical protein